jgi:hypothetical protein
MNPYECGQNNAINHPPYHHFYRWYINKTIQTIPSHGGLLASFDPPIKNADIPHRNSGFTWIYPLIA